MCQEQVGNTCPLLDHTRASGSRSRRLLAVLDCRIVIEAGRHQAPQTGPDTSSSAINVSPKLDPYTPLINPLLTNGD